MMRAGLALVLLGGCDEVISVRNEGPSVDLTAYCTGAADDRVYFHAEVLDLEGDPVDLDLVASLDGQTVVLGAGSAGDGVVGLSSDEVGVGHVIEWGRACGGDGCVDPCTDRAVGPSGVTACRPSPAPVPTSLAVTVHATDGQSRFEKRFDLTVGPCSE